jgi:hypothetical protein
MAAQAATSGGGSKKALSTSARRRRRGAKTRAAASARAAAAKPRAIASAPDAGSAPSCASARSTSAPAWRSAHRVTKRACDNTLRPGVQPRRRAMPARYSRTGSSRDSPPASARSAAVAAAAAAAALASAGVLIAGAAAAGGARGAACAAGAHARGVCVRRAEGGARTKVPSAPLFVPMVSHGVARRSVSTHRWRLALWSAVASPQATLAVAAHESAGRESTWRQRKSSSPSEAWLLRLLCHSHARMPGASVRACVPVATTLTWLRQSSAFSSFAHRCSQHAARQLLQQRVHARRRQARRARHRRAVRVAAGRKQRRKRSSRI